jgi:two-component system heavy metal sensor histidine kinase CusS
MFSRFAMRLCNPRTWSLTTRLTLLFTIAIGVILMVVSTMMYAELVHQLHEKEEAELTDDLHIQLDVFAYVGKRDGANQWQRTSPPQRQESRRFAWQLLDAHGAVRMASANAPGVAATIARVPDTGRFARVADDAKKWGRYLLLYRVSADSVTGAGDSLRGILDITEDERVLFRYLRMLCIVVGVSIVLSAWLGWAFARRGLAPVRAISAAIGRVNAEKLSARIANETWPSDLRQLAATFDDLLARLERSFEQLTRFSSDLAHEFRSPINNMVAAAGVTLGRARDVTEYERTLEVMVEEGNRLSRMVSSMLFLARADNASQTLHTEGLSAGTEFGKLADFFGIMAEEKGIALRSEGDALVTADPLLLRRALSNLVANALRHTSRGGSVVMRAEVHDANVVLSVSDDGIGIADDHLPYLFDRFYRVDAARSAIDSTGLGLAVVRSIAELHGGTVSVESKPGQGSCFSMRFPCGGTRDVKRVSA